MAGCPSALYMSVSARIQTNHVRVLVRVNKYMTCFVYECECTHTNKSHTCISACIQICDVLGRGTDMDTKLQVKCDGMSECFVYERERTYTNNQEVCM